MVGVTRQHVESRTAISYAERMFSRQGQSLIELLIAIGLSAVLLPALIVGLVATRSGKPQERQRLQATAVLTQTQEELRSIREKDWTTFAVNGTFHTTLSGSSWSLATGAATLTNGLTQSIKISDVYRDTTGKIVSSGGTIDPSTKYVVTTISWSQPYSSSVTAETYLTRYLGSASWIQTSLADFQSGTTSSTVVTNKTGGGGEVILGAGVGHDWCDPIITQYSFQLPGAGNPNLTYAFPGNAFVGTNQNSSGDMFGHISITYSGITPSISYVGLRIPGTKTNAVSADSTYGYLATTKGLVIVTLSTMTQLGNSTPIGYSDAIAVSGNRVYMTSSNTFYVIDVSNLNSPSILGQVGISGTGMQMVVNGTNVYLVTNSTTNQLQIINVSNPSSPSVTRSVSMGNNQAGQAVAVNPTATRAYVVTSYTAGQSDYFIIDTSTGNKLGSYSTNGMSPSSVAVATGNHVIVVGTGGETYQVLDNSNETSPILCGGVTTSYPIFGVATVTETDGVNYSYLVTNDTYQFKIIEGGSGSAYASSGTFTSSVFDPGYPVAYNYFTATIADPTQTNLQMQVATATPSGGVCPSATSAYTFVGPGASTSAYFTPVAASISGVIPFSTVGPYLNPQRCYRYKTYFTSNDQAHTPVLYDVTTTYTP